MQNKRFGVQITFSVLFVWEMSWEENQLPHYHYPARIYNSASEVPGPMRQSPPPQVPRCSLVYPGIRRQQPRPELLLGPPHEAS
jgi:hypothetical protein